MTCRTDFARIFACAFLGLAAAGAVAQDDGLQLHEDYYLGFSQGVYYGLLMAGVEYDVAWCMKAELDYEADRMGSGGEFQKKMDAILAKCRSESATDE